MRKYLNASDIFARKQPIIVTFKVKIHRDFCRGKNRRKSRAIFLTNLTFIFRTTLKNHKTCGSGRRASESCDENKQKRRFLQDARMK